MPELQANERKRRDHRIKALILYRVIVINVQSFHLSRDCSNIHYNFVDWLHAVPNIQPIYYCDGIRATIITAATGTLPGNHTMITLAHWQDGRIAEEYLFSN